jgi:uncharacterized cupredoxin-like copper-binding protein
MSAMAITSCGSGPTSSSGAAGLDTTVAGAPPGNVLDVTLTDFSFAAAVKTVAAGAVTLNVRNDGSEAHELTIGRPPLGTTAENYAKQHAELGLAALYEKIDWFGGAGGIEPGATSTSTVELTPGDYVMVCYLPGSDGQSHMAKSMVAPLTVVTSDTSAHLEPEPDAISLNEFSFTMPDNFNGKGSYTVTNEGQQPHEIDIVRLEDDKTLSDGFTWFTAGAKGRPPFRYMGGSGSMSTGKHTRMHLDLGAGNYVALCLVPDLHGEGKPHALMGMLKTFTLT